MSPQRRQGVGRKSRAGVVLVDIIVATVILGVALTLLIGMASRATTAQTLGERLQVAAMLADEQLNLVVARGADSYAGRFDTSGSCDAPFQDYRYELDITGGSTGTAYSVTATILWRDGLRERSVSVDTLIAPRLGDDPDPERRPQEMVEREGE